MTTDPAAPEFCDASTPWADHTGACCSGCNWTAAPEDESHRFYAVSDLPLGARVFDGKRYGSIVRRAASTWVDRDSKLPKIRWDGNIDAQEVTWQELEKFAAPVPAVEGLTEAEKASIAKAGDHHPETCDCSVYAEDGGYPDHDICTGLADTLAAVERIVAERVAAAKGEA